MISGTVADLVVRLPKTLAPTTTVRQARAAFADDHVHMLLLTAAGRLLGTLVRDDLVAADDEDDLALVYATLAGRTVRPTESAEKIRLLLVVRGERRRAVVDRDGRLLGLLCLKRRRAGFCSDADIARRSTARLVTDSGRSLR
jgi:CBS domain-containing protein